jgi:hypothetical protein
MEAIVGEWAASDPDAVAEWLNGLEDKPDYHIAGSALAKNWIRNDPQEAIRYLESLDGKPGFERIASAAVGEWSRFQPDQAFRWAGPVYREEPLANVDTALWLWAQTDFESAADYLLGATDVDVQRQFVSSLLTDYAEKIPAGAADWVEQAVIDPSVRAVATGHVASTWWDVDRVAVSDWIGTLPEGQARDAAVEALVSRAASLNREEAVRWASTLSDSVRRAEWLRKLSE